MPKLSARRVASFLKVGRLRRYGDGANLYLQVNGPSHGAWVFLYKPRGTPRQRVLGLGSTRDVTLAEARALADACRRAVRDGRDPKLARTAQLAGGYTFDAAARELIANMAPSWRSAKHLTQWRMTLLGPTNGRGGSGRRPRLDYCAAIRAKPVAALTTEDALRVLKPVWQARPETANRLRGRCERVWDFAKARGHCSGENPFRWRGHLAALLPKRSHLSRGHFTAMPFAEVPAFTCRLQTIDSMAARALEFIILTAARSGEALGAHWSEIDFAAKIWTVPAERMKGGRQHRVPLSDRALAILAELQQARLSDLVFPGRGPGRPLSNAALALVLRRAKVAVTTHGFRSSFRDWAGDSTPFARDVVEAALAHAIENRTEAAYRRSDALEKRRKLMAAWAAYCNSAKAPGNVTPLRRAT
jgi:integrase